MKPGSWRIRDARLSLDVPLVMGILNVTPDSFSDGGDHLNPDTAVAAGLAMIKDGASIVDVGGESTRPGAEPVTVETELSRVLPVIDGLVAGGTVVSIDTSKPAVAEKCAEAGAHIVNDITALAHSDAIDPSSASSSMASVCADAGVGVILMHMLGSPATMQKNPTYDDVVPDIVSYLERRVEVATAAGISPAALAIDPGIGFGKTFEHNIDLMANLTMFTRLDYPVVVGASRKGFLGSILNPIRGVTATVDRDGATAATVALAVAQGVSILRVHNVRLGVDVALTANAMVPVEGYDQEINRT